MELITVIDLHLVEGVCGAMRLEVDLTYKLVMSPSCSSQEL